MKSTISGERLGVLLDTTILSYFETMSLVEDTAVFDEMFKHLLNGNLDSVFISPKLDNVPFEEREKAFDIARINAGLCFYKENPDYWTESVEGYNPNDPLELISEEVLDNYNFLVELAHEKGEDAVSELHIFDDIDIDSSIIDYLRNVFDNDQVLKNTLDSTSKGDGIYKDLTPEEKRVLYTYPEGVLYSDEESISDMLLNRIADYCNDNDINKMNSISEVADYLGNDLYSRVIRDIHLDNSKSLHY